MDILKIKDPKFLKKMKIKDLYKLSDDIRNFIINSISKTGGHLSSNLGIVELTIALHKTFDFSKDKLIFDVSHQCYVHKILTGRADKFNTLRQYNGLSGFQKMTESIYDHYESGHSSTSLSAALGYALARDYNKQKHHVVALIGDGSIGNGISYEALNHIGSLNTKLIIILNDNEMSISKNIGSLHNYLDKIRNAYYYHNIKNKTKVIFNKIPLIGKHISLSISEMKKSFKRLYLKEGYVFSELGFSYYGPINGHDYHELLYYLNMAKKETKPVIIHVITEKGKGYLPAYNDKIGLWHGVPSFDITTGKFNNKSDNLITWSEVVSNHLINLTKKNKDLIVITPAMASGSKLLKYKELYPNNFIDVGIAEEHAVLLANGLSLGGKIPFVSIYSTFMQRAYDEIIHDVARMKSHVIIGVDRSGIVGEDGETHQGIYDLTFLLPIPNLIITSPKDSNECGNLLYTAVNTKKPFVMRYSKDKLNYQSQEYKLIKIGSWEELTQGHDAYLISYGYMLNIAYEVYELLKKENINITVVNARFLKPIDEEYFINILKANKKIFVLEENCKIGSFGSYLINKMYEYNYKNDIYLYGIEDKFVTHGKKDEILKSLKLNSESIKEDIKKKI